MSDKHDKFDGACFFGESCENLMGGKHKSGESFFKCALVSDIDCFSVLCCDRFCELEE